MIKTHDARVLVVQIHDILSALKEAGYPLNPVEAPDMGYSEEAITQAKEDEDIESLGLPPEHILEALMALSECLVGLELFLTKESRGTDAFLEDLLKFVYGISFSSLLVDGRTKIEMEWPSENRDVVQVSSAVVRGKENWGALNRWKFLKEDGFDDLGDFDI
jgi:hypothetical protein